MKIVAAGPVAVLGDIHPPYHDPAALTVCCKVLQAAGPAAIVFNGDCFDNYQLSRFDGDPTRRLQLQEDLGTAKQILAGFRQVFPRIPFFYKWGNHEERLERWLHAHPEVAGLDCLKLNKLLDLDKIDCALVPAAEPLWLDRFFITHGDRVRAKAGYTAHSMIEKYGLSGISNHVHRLAYVRRKQWDRDMQWIENGCLCDLQPHYADMADWQQGFTLLSREGADLHPELVPIREGRAWFRGRLYRA